MSKKVVSHSGIKKRMCSLVLFEEHNDLEAVIKLVKQLASDSWLDAYAMIIHDKDVYTQAEQAEDEDREDKKQGIVAGTKKPRHLHIGLRFHTPKSFGNIAKKFNVPVELVQPIKSGSFDRYTLYLTHETREAIKQGKHLYSDDEVISNIEGWADMKNADKVHQEAVEQDKKLNWYIQEILVGRITRADIGGKLPELIYIKKKTTFDYAFERAREKEVEKMLANGEYHATVIYIHGGSGMGKTTLAKRLSEQLTGGLPYVSGTGSDPFGGYKGERAVILDDVRPDTFDYNEWLKQLDPNTLSETHSRYKNKLVTAPLIIITNCLALDEFIQAIDRTVDEDDKQFKRRINTLIEISSDEYVISEYQEDGNDYKEVSRKRNDMKEYLGTLNKKQITTEDIISALED